MTDSSNMLNLLEDLLAKAKAKGADAADAVHIESQSLAVAQRLSNPEKLERSESADIGLRALVGKRQAIVSSSDIGTDALDELVERVVAMAKSVPEDFYCGIADPDQLATEIVDVESCDPNEPTAETLVDWANRAEESARAIEGITNSEGAEAGWGRATVSVAATNGFAQTYSGSHYSLSASVLAGEGTAMERDYDYTGAVYADDLMTPEEIGTSAGEKAVKRLNPQKAETAEVPVIYDPRVSRGIVMHLTSAINGSSIARETSFLKDKMGEQVFSAGMTIYDDPHRARGLRSKPFDSEGVANKKRKIIEDGVLTTWIMDLRSSRQLGLETTGHASRGTGSPPSPSATNVYLESGSGSPAELMSDIKSGLYITELIGMGINGLTGDYSRGAAGFWIENGELTHPVSEITIAGNLKDMFKNLTAADDLEYRYGIDAPTLRIDGMTLAGK
ncbi:MAG: metallopeptidase TldD-related protein [Rhodospirillales bacterium]|jgi:PmbA protein|nr:metallopeptidase TldD-related protein [Rhodospirillales bacterium]